MGIKATNDKVWVVREKAQKESGGILIPDAAKKQTHKGLILSVGDLVSDKNIRQEKIAIFNKSAGFEIEEAGTTYTILAQIDIIGIE